MIIVIITILHHITLYYALYYIIIMIGSCLWLRIAVAVAVALRKTQGELRWSIWGDRQDPCWAEARRSSVIGQAWTPAVSPTRDTKRNAPVKGEIYGGWNHGNKTPWKMGGVRYFFSPIQWDSDTIAKWCISSIYVHILYHVILSSRHQLCIYMCTFISIPLAKKNQ